MRMIVKTCCSQPGYSPRSLTLIRCLYSPGLIFKGHRRRVTEGRGRGGGEGRRRDGWVRGSDENYTFSVQLLQVQDIQFPIKTLLVQCDSKL